MFGLFRRRKAKANPGRELYFAILAQARLPAFYGTFAVPDTLDGRFEMVVLHAALVFRRLRALGPAALALADQAFDVMTADLDRSVRELGVGDLGVARRVKTMARGFYGRAEAYDRALGGAAALEDAVRRNIYGTVTAEDAVVARMAAYVLAAAAAADRQELADLTAGQTGFPLPAVIDPSWQGH